MLHNFRRALAALTLTLLLSPILALDGNSLGSCTIQPFAVAVQGASPQESQMPQGKAVLRLIVCRRPMPYCAHPTRSDALNFLGAYVVETLECGHKLEAFFNPPMENLIAKRRRCRECDEAGNVIEITTGKKKPAVSVEIPAAERKQTVV